MNEIAAIILAGGKGVRMESDLPKVIHPLRDKPLILYVVDSLRKVGITHIITVVGYKGEMVLDILDTKVKHVWQRQQLGTGHAVMQAEEALAGFDGTLIIACGDVPLIKPATFENLIRESREEKTKAVVLTMTLEKPTGYGRIMKNVKNEFVKIVEEKDATPEQRLIKEVNTGTYAFDKAFLFEGLKKINTDNAQREYYLPDALNHVLASGYKVKTVMLDNPIEGSGINTRNDLLTVESFLGSN